MRAVYTYTMLPPQLSEPLIIDSQVARTDRALIAWASMYILREFDEMLSSDGWLIFDDVDPEALVM